MQSAKHDCIRRFSRVTAFGVATVLLLSSCQATQDLLADRGNRYCLQGGGLGTLAGGGIGAGIGAALGGRQGALIGGLLGAAVGGLSGCRYGIWVAERRETYDSEQERLNAELTNAQETNASLASLNAQLESDFDQRRQTLEKLQAEREQTQAAVAQRSKFAEELQANLKGVTEQTQKAEEELAVHQRELARLQAAASQVDPDELEQYRTQVAEMDREVRQLRNITQQYAEASAAAV